MILQNKNLAQFLPEVILTYSKSSLNVVSHGIDFAVSYTQLGFTLSANFSCGIDFKGKRQIGAAASQLMH